MYVLKYQPEDFIVEEVMDLPLKNQGPYSYFLLQKRDVTTQFAIELCANTLGIPLKYINISGTKDKRAVTKQYISINGLAYEKRRHYSFSDVELTYLGQGAERISLGMHKANRFKILVRNISTECDFSITSIPNYFGMQRFSKDNARIGRCIVQGNYREAAQGLVATKASSSIGKYAGNYIAALQSLPSSLLRLYLHAFQSYLWNLAMSTFLSQYCRRYNIQTKEYMQADVPLVYPLQDIRMRIGFPLVGFDYEEVLENYERDLAPEFKEGFAKSILVVTQYLKEHNISPRDFILRSLPEFTLETQMRKGMVSLQEFKCIWGEDEYHLKKKKVMVVFTLEPSSYATIALQALFAGVDE